MNDLTQQITGEFVPEMAIVIYKWKGRNDYYLERHEIDDKGMLGAGVPLESDMLDGMAAFLNEKRKENSYISGMLPGNVLYCDWREDRKVMLWYNEPMERQMFFTKKLNIKNGVAWQPGLLYLVENDELNVWALKGGWPLEHKLSKLVDVYLYRAPYHNVSEWGDVCLGSASIAKPRQVTYEGIINYWEGMFWQSEFSHLADNDTPILGNLNVYWDKAISEKQYPFDYSVLKGMEGQRISDLLKRLMR